MNFSPPKAGRCSTQNALATNASFHQKRPSKAHIKTMQLHIHRQGQRLDPFSPDTVDDMLWKGALSPDDLVWQEGTPEWMTLAAFKAARQPSSARAIATPPLMRQTVAGPALGAALAGVSGLTGMTSADLQTELQRGGKFVIYQYCISVLVMTFKRSSGIHFIKAGESAAARGLSYTAISFFCGWWGIPWGPIWTITTIANNSSGGRDVTSEVRSALGRVG
jgi:hypothetical protein